MKQPAPTKPRYANSDHPTIAAVLHELFRLGNEQQAKAKIDEIKAEFTIAKKQLENPAHPSLILWIRGFGLEEGDAAKGIIGHYAVISYKPVGEKFTLFATKMLAPASEHPMRAQIKRETPNWGHPVLRSVRKGRIYQTLEAANAELELLHSQYPTLSIPNPGKLYIMIYCADRKPRERLVKHTLTVQAAPDGSGFFLECTENTYRPRTKTAPIPTKPSEESIVKGVHTAQLAAKRLKKPKK